MSELKENKNIILLDYYEGAYGPTIRIDIHTVTALDKVRNFFLQLAESKKQRINFIEIDSVKATGFSQFILKLVPENQEPQKKLEL